MARVGYRLGAINLHDPEQWSHLLHPQFEAAWIVLIARILKDLCKKFFFGLNLFPRLGMCALWVRTLKENQHNLDNSYFADPKQYPVAK